MIRETSPDDTEQLIRIAIEVEMFPAEASGFLEEMFSTHFASGDSEGHVCLTDAEDGEPCVMAYARPVEATDGTWNLLMIAVAPGKQGRGRGRALMESVEATLTKRGERLLLVETSGLESYAKTRRFYAGCGYTETARVPDYYAAGEDMVLFRKSLGGKADH